MFEGLSGDETGGDSQILCCPVCHTPSDKKCSACHKVAYCSQEHQKKDWKSHKKSCRSFTIMHNQSFGRFLVATRDIPQGDTVFFDQCLTFGPKRSTYAVCLGCHKRLYNADYRCSKCTYPMCSEDCEKIPIHAENECIVFQRAAHPVGAKINNFESICPAYESITPIRCLLLKVKSPQKWDKLITMEDHNETRKSVSGLWNRNFVNVVKLLLEWCKMKEEPYYLEEDSIHSVLGYIDVNCFEIKYKDVEICGVYKDAGLMCHDCVPNTHNAIKMSEDHQMVVRSSIPIKKGEMITTSYSDQLSGTRERRWFLKDTKYFDCFCNRCKDPSEFATYISAVKCGECATGYLLPRNPTSFSGTDWICTNGCFEDKMNNNENGGGNHNGGGKGCCNKIMKEEQILNILKKVRKDIEETTRSTAGSAISKLERLLKKYSGKVLHPNHYLMLGILKHLNFAYAKDAESGREKDGEEPLKETELDHLNRSKTLNLQMLSVLDMIDPGLTRLRGVTLFQLSVSEFQLCQQKYQRGEILKDDFKDNLNKILAYLLTSKEIMELDKLVTVQAVFYGKISGQIKKLEDILDSLN